ncbi:MAG: hypothetical protein AAFQ11_03795 [Pseudomonadota bacterium]
MSDQRHPLWKGAQRKTGSGGGSRSPFARTDEALWRGRYTTSVFCSGHTIVDIKSEVVEPGSQAAALKAGDDAIAAGPTSRRTDVVQAVKEAIARAATNITATECATHPNRKP